MAAALNFNGTGPRSEASGPVLTRSNGVRGGRRRRTVQTGAAALQPERDALEAATAREAELVGSIEAAVGAMGAWARDFGVRMGRRPTDDDKLRSAAWRGDLRALRLLKFVAQQTDRFGSSRLALLQLGDASGQRTLGALRCRLGLESQTRLGGKGCF